MIQGKVLLVEDSTAWLRRLEEGLADRFEVISAASMEEALRISEQEPALRVVITDTVFANGVRAFYRGEAWSDLRRFVRGLRVHNRSLPIIVYSALPGDMSKGFLREGVNLVINKARSTPRELAEEVNAAIASGESSSLARTTALGVSMGPTDLVAGQQTPSRLPAHVIGSYCFCGVGMVGVISGLIVGISGVIRLHLIDLFLWVVGGGFWALVGWRAVRETKCDSMTEK